MTRNLGQVGTNQAMNSIGTMLDRYTELVIGDDERSLELQLSFLNGVLAALSLVGKKNVSVDGIYADAECIVHALQSQLEERVERTRDPRRPPKNSIHIF